MNTFVLLALVDSTGIYRLPFAVLLPLCTGHVADLEFRLLSPLAGARHARLPNYVRHAEPLVALFARCLGLLNTTPGSPAGSPHASLNTHSVSRKHVLPFLATHEHLQLELSVGDKLSAMTLRETLALQLTGNRIRVTWQTDEHRHVVESPARASYADGGALLEHAARLAAWGSDELTPLPLALDHRVGIQDYGGVEVVHEDDIPGHALQAFRLSNPALEQPLPGTFLAKDWHAFLAS
jgi:hypothetical protein